MNTACSTSAQSTVPRTSSIGVPGSATLLICEEMASYRASFPSPDTGIGELH